MQGVGAASVPYLLAPHFFFILSLQTPFMTAVFPSGVGWWVDGYTGNLLVVDRERGWSDRFQRYRCVTAAGVGICKHTPSFPRLYLDDSMSRSSGARPTYKQLLEMSEALRNRCLHRGGACLRATGSVPAARNPPTC